MARYMKKFVPGLDVTDEVIERLKGSKDPQQEGINICVDIINQVREIPGVAGIHIMAIGWEQIVPEIVSLAGLHPRPKAKEAESRLKSSDTIELLVSKTKEDVKAQMEKVLEQAKVEEQKSKDLLAKEKEKSATEISGLKNQIQEVKQIVSKKEDEINRLTQELKQVESGPLYIQSAKTAAEEKEAREFLEQDRSVLASIRHGLEALRKALGLNEDHLEALRQFFEAEFLLLHRDKIEKETMPVEKVKPAPEKETEKLDAETKAKHREVVNFIAKGNVLLHKNDLTGAIDAFEKALAIEPEEQQAQEGLRKAREFLKSTKPLKKPAIVSTPAEIPPCPEELSPEEWQRKWVIRLVAKGNICLNKDDIDGALNAFNQALELDPNDQKAKAGLSEAKSKSSAPGIIKEKPEVKEKEKVSEKIAKKVETEVASIPEAKGPSVKDLYVFDLPKEARSLKERAGSVPEDKFKEPCTGTILKVNLDEGDRTLTVGGSSALPFHLFEGDMPYMPKVAYDVWDSKPEDWPEALKKYYSDVYADPVAWAQKCINHYGAEAICLSLVSTDPNGMNRSSAEAAKSAQSVIEKVDVPVILWGCENAEKDTETLREVINLVGNRKVCLAPLIDANYRSLGATAMAFQLPVVASTPIDVNLAKQLNILLENLGLPLDHILMDTSIGAVGYGIEYSYSVMERIRLAALTQQDEKLQVPFICNLGKEVWKTKECQLPSDAYMGDQERRGVLMEAITASTLLFAGGELMVMTHPQAVAMTKALIKGMI
jgi:CO dehydrogenase/acetyl-CoA synthase delta subunit